MKVKIKLYGHLSELLQPTGEAEIELEKATLRELLEILDKKSEGKLLARLLNDKGELRNEYMILINGVPPLKGLEETLSDQSFIAILPQVGGGSPLESVSGSPVEDCYRL
ncbi:MAG: MoaD/ThiS family protein [Thermoprotei archaeon]|nr:MoaD/ThiS family protein [Thermoprotei archaeon]